MINVVIVGGGASGIMCALHLSKLSSNFNITILEKQDRIGKKILVTGNGKCNLTNKYITKNNYNHPEFIDSLLNKFSFEECQKYFSKLGLLFQTDDVGRSYPYSESAKAFLDLLMYHLEKGKVNIKTNCEVIDVVPACKGYLVKTNDKEYFADVIVFASGGQASINFENKTYQILQKLNHTIIPIYPGLVPLKVKENLKHLHGVRVKAQASLIKDHQVLTIKNGQVQFRSDSLSGIVIFELSSIYNRLPQKNNVFVSLDLMPNYTSKEIYDLLFSKKQSGFSNEEVLIGLFNKMIIWELNNRIKNKSNYLRELTTLIKDFRFTVINSNSLNEAQVTLGGIDINEITTNFESIYHPNMFIIGELLDIDGDTGGYNLHFAWLSGIICANNIYKKF